MKINQAAIYIVKLPLKKLFKHGSFERTYNEIIFLELKDKKNIGFGECLPREYVTGETPEKVVENLKKYISKIPKEFKNLEEIINFLNECEPEDSRNMASLCGLDLALLDLYGKNKNRSLSEVLGYESGYEKKEKDIRVTSAPLDLNSPSWKKTLYCLAGLRDIKLKINPETSGERINKIGSGKLIKTFRLDGNCSLTPKQLEPILTRVNVKIGYIEQPFPVGIEKNWTGVKFMADESLVSLKDAKTINFDAASIRIGKNGGILRTLDIIKEWENRKKEYMLGSLVGETSLLSAALMHLASITKPILIEGCYSTRLLIKDPTDIHPSVSYKGKVKFDYSKYGLGTNLYLEGIEVKKIELI